MIFLGPPFFGDGGDAWRMGKFLENIDEFDPAEMGQKWNLFTKCHENRVGDPLLILLVCFLGCAVSCAFLVDEILRNQRASPQILQATSGSGWFRRVAGSSFAALTLSERHRISGRKGGEGGESISDVGSSKRNQDKLGWQQAEVEERPLGGNAA